MAAALDLWDDYDAAILWQHLDDLSEQIQEDLQLGTIGTITVGGFTATLSVSYVLWTSRAGYLLASFLASTPVWQQVDPLPILEFPEAAVSDKKRKKAKSPAPSGSLMDGIANS